MKILLIITITFFSFLALAKEEKKDSIHQIQKIGEKEFYYLVDNASSDDTTVNILHYNYALKYTNDGGQTHTYQQLDTINEILLKAGNPVSEINLFYVDKSLGFIYGYINAFGHIPFLFRTKDAGKTWSIVMYGLGPQLHKSKFFMFNKKQGIMLYNSGGDPVIEYKLTTDGGKTWNSKTYELSNKDFHILNSPKYFSVIYSAEGMVTIIIQDYDNEKVRRNKVAIIKSSDFGETFVECFDE